MDTGVGSCALVTVTTANFLPGTVVLLHSFLQHNDWFDGDIVVIHDNLEPKPLSILQNNFDRIKFVSPSGTLLERLDALVEAFPKMKGRIARFHSLEVITMDQYDKLLFCDSDMLFRGSVQDLFKSNGDLICCGDGPFFRNNARDSASFDEIPKMGASGELHQCFNAGFMIMDRSIRSQENYQALLEMIDLQFWQRVKTAHTDQLLYNIFFDGRQQLVDAANNFLMSHRFDIYEKYGTRLEDARVIHYNGPAKPWLPGAVLSNFKRDPALISALRHWHLSFTDFLEAASLKMIEQ